MRNAIVASVLMFALSGILAWGQAVTTGTITGSTKDESGASMPGVTLTLTSTTTGQVTTVISDDTGSYRFLSIPSGSGYVMKAELPSFKAVTVSDISVRPGGSQRFDLVMPVGQVTEELMVTADAPLINTESSSVVEALNESFAATIPLQRRDFTEIAVLFQGTQHSASDDSGFFVQFHARGMATTSNGYRMDGANANYMQSNRAGLRMTKTAVAQYEVLTQGFSAEYGENAGEIINLVTKSGKNDAFWDYTFLYKPEALTSNIQSGLPNQVSQKAKGWAHWQEYSIGGAIIKNKLFIFNAFQYQEEVVGNLVTPKSRHAYFTSDHLKVTYAHSPNDQWNFTIDGNTGYNHNTSFRNSQISPESEGDQRVPISFSTIKNTRTFGGHLVMDTTTSFHDLDVGVWPEARLYHRRGMYTGPLRSKDFVTVFSPTLGQFTTGPAATEGSAPGKRFRISEKIANQTHSHNLRFGGDYSRTWGEPWTSQARNVNRDPATAVRSFTDQRGIRGSLTRTDFLYGAPENGGRAQYRDNQTAVYIQDGWKIVPRVLLEMGFRMEGQTRLHNIHHAAPRVGLTIDPTGKGRSRVFANWGFYYEQINGDLLNFDKRILLQRLYRVDNADLNFNGTDVLLNTFRAVMSPTFDSPLVNAWSTGYEFMLPAQFKVGVTYAANRQHRRNTTLRTATTDFLNNDGRASYRGLEFNFRRPFSKGLEISGNYTRSRSLGDVGGEVGSTPVTVIQLPYRYAHLDWHEPNAGSVVAMQEVFGFLITPKFLFNSGRPYSITSPTVGTAIAYVDRQGNPGARNIYQASSRWTLDFTLQRRFSTEKFRVSPMMQVLNVTNRVNVLGVSSNFFTPGLPTNVGDSRQIQVGLDFSFGR